MPPHKHLLTRVAQFGERIGLGGSARAVYSQESLLRSNWSREQLAETFLEVMFDQFIGFEDGRDYPS